jgi:hypothetical protein
MTVIRVAMSGHGTDKPPAAAGGRHTDFAAELVSFMRLALADALHMRLMNAVDFLLVVPLLIGRCGLQYSKDFSSSSG